MLKMPSFDTNARPETFVPLIHCVIFIDDTLSQATTARSSEAAHVRQRHELGVTNVSVHATMPKEDTLLFNVTQEYTSK